MTARKPPPTQSPKPWATRSRSTKTAATRNELFQAVGMALTAWEGVENALADVYTLLIGAREIIPPSVPAVRAYGAVAAFSTRADMLEAAAQGFFEWFPTRIHREDPAITKHRETLGADFKLLLQEARGFVQRRNEIAHGIASGDDYACALSPPLYNARKYPAKSPELTIGERAAFHYVAEDINHYEEQFRGLTKRLFEYARQLRYLPQPSPHTPPPRGAHRKRPPRRSE